MRMVTRLALWVQNELKELSTVKADLAAQLSDSSGKIHVSTTG